MTIGKATALSVGFVGAVALGVWIGPSLTGRAETPAAAVDTAPVTDAATPASEARTTPRTASAETSFRAVPASSPDLHKRLKPVLMEGMSSTIASQGFRDGEQFAAVAHAARNTGINFMLLKDRVLMQHKSLAAAIRELKPDVNAAREANRAAIMARADIAALSV